MEFGKKHRNVSNKVGYYNGLVVKKDSKGRYITKSSKKQYLPKGTRVHSKKENSKKSKRDSKMETKKPKKETKKPKKYKEVKSKDKTQKVIGKRLSARAVFDEKGVSSIGKSFNILQPNGSMKMKVLRLRKNGSPYFANKFGLCLNCSNSLFGKSVTENNRMNFGNSHVHNCFG
jgi:hypothetical protein